MTEVDKINGLHEMNYYVLSERKIAEDVKSFPYFKSHPECLQHIITDGFEKKGKRYVGTDNKSNYKIKIRRILL